MEFKKVEKLNALYKLEYIVVMTKDKFQLPFSILELY